MITKVGKEEILDECAELIRKGEIVAFPTETVYGLGGNALNESAVKKIYEAKQRPSDNPFIVHVYDMSDIDEVAYLSKEAEQIFRRFTPGPLTIVLPKKSLVPDCVTAGLNTVGIRMPSHSLGREFLKRCALPIAAPSANKSKRVSPTTAEHVFEDMNGLIPAIIDGGQCSVGIESTVLGLFDEPIVLRPGAITAEMLKEFLPNVKAYKRKPDEELKVVPAPGMKYKHYAPIVPCVLYATPESGAAEYAKRSAQGLNPVILAKSADCVKLLRLTDGKNIVSLGDTDEEFMRNIFSSLRIYEKTNGYIIVQALGSEGIEGSIMNRLIKSSEGTIV